MNKRLHVKGMVLAINKLNAFLFGVACFLLVPIFSNGQISLKAFAGGGMEHISPGDEYVDVNIRPSAGLRYQWGKRYVQVSGSLTRIRYEVGNPFFYPPNTLILQDYYPRFVLGTEYGKIFQKENAEFGLGVGYNFDFGGRPMNFYEFRLYDFVSELVEGFSNNERLHHAYLNFHYSTKLNEKFSLETYFQPGIMTAEHLIMGSAWNYTLGVRLAYERTKKPFKPKVDTISGFNKKGLLLGLGMRATAFHFREEWDAVRAEPVVKIGLKLGVNVLSYELSHRIYESNVFFSEAPLRSQGLSHTFGFGRLYNLGKKNDKLSFKLFYGLVNQSTSYFGLEFTHWHPIMLDKGLWFTTSLGYEHTPYVHSDASFSAYNTAHIRFGIIKAININ